MPPTLAPRPISIPAPRQRSPTPSASPLALARPTSVIVLVLLLLLVLTPSSPPVSSAPLPTSVPSVSELRVLCGKKLGPPSSVPSIIRVP